jgi:hypothetical protein
MLLYPTIPPTHPHKVGLISLFQLHLRPGIFKYLPQRTGTAPTKWSWRECLRRKTSKIHSKWDHGRSKHQTYPCLPCNENCNDSIKIRQNPSKSSQIRSEWSELFMILQVMRTGSPTENHPGAVHNRQPLWVGHCAHALAKQESTMTIWRWWNQWGNRLEFNGYKLYKR